MGEDKSYGHGRLDEKVGRGASPDEEVAGVAGPELHLTRRVLWKMDVR